jgi:hypothetical protein
MALLLVLLATLQVAQPDIVAPQGWSVRDSAIPWLEHATGASVRVMRFSQRGTLETYARDAAERVMRPLGFGKLSAPTYFRNSEQEWIQYEIWGNRLSERRRILYRAIRRSDALFEIIYENSEERFDVLSAEAQSLASALLERIVERERLLRTSRVRRPGRR